MKKALSLALTGLTIFTLAGCFGDDSELTTREVLENQIVANAEFEKYYHYSSENCNSIDLTEAVKITNKESGQEVKVIESMVSWGEAGAPKCGASASKEEKEYKFKVETVYGSEIDAQYEGSVFVSNLYTAADAELKYISGEQREEYVAAAENFLIESGAGGVPLYSNGSYRVYNERFTRANEEYQVVMGYAENFGTIAKDDKDLAEKLGGNIFAKDRTVKENTKTLRYWASSTASVSTLNPWNQSNTTESAISERIFDSLYKGVRGTNNQGVAYVPSMASANPIAVGNVKIEANNDESSTEFVIPLDADLTFHDGEAIDANDFVETYLLAFQQGWSRVSGLVASDFSIKGASEFRSSEDKSKEKWDSKVGLKALSNSECNELLGNKQISGTCLKYTLENSVTEWDVRYSLGTASYSPVHSSYRSEAKAVNYGKYSDKSFDIITNGAFVLDTLQDSVEQHFIRADHEVSEGNYNKELVERYTYDEYNVALLADSLAAFDEFDNGKLDYATVPGTLFEENKNNSTIKQVPGTTVWRLGINGLGTNENQKVFAESEAMTDLGRQINKNYDPEVILSNTNIKNAMYLAIDRTKLAETDLATSETSGHIFGRAFTADPQGDSQEYRKTEAGKAVGKKFGTDTSTAGYNPTGATLYFEAGIKELINAGIITSGQDITIDFRMFASTTTTDTITDHVKAQFETHLKSSEYDINLKVNVDNAQGTENIYDDFRAANFDIGFMSITGSSLAPESFLDNFSDLYSSSFNYNYGADTSSPEIRVEIDGETVYVSYNALQRLLNGYASVENGRLV